MQVVPKLTERAPEEICRKAGIPLLLASSIKAGLDIDWSDAKQKAAAVEVVERQVSSLQQWVDRHLDEVVSEPLRPYIDGKASPCPVVNSGSGRSSRARAQAGGICQGKSVSPRSAASTASSKYFVGWTPWSFAVSTSV